VEEGEGILAAARRELAEEAGVTPRALRLRGVIHEAERGYGVVVFVFTGTCAGTELRCSPEGTPGWFTDEQVAGLELVADVGQILARLLTMRADDPPFLARSVVDAAGRPTLAFEE